MTEKIQTWGRLGFRWLTSIAITYLFLVLVMTAAAQQRVTATLDEAFGKVSYSAALSKVKAAEQLRRDLPKLHGSAATLGNLTLVAQQRLDGANADLDEAWNDTAGLLAAVARAGACGDMGMADAADQRWALWRRVTGCAAAGNLSDDLVARIRVSQANPEGFQRRYAAALAARSELAQHEENLRRVREEVRLQTAEVQEARALQAVFAELDILRRGWLAMAAVIVEVPPSMLQILLAFSAGMFGALLVTLVLVVYPQSQLASAAGHEYGSRILLGGLISVGVYVILGGGSAVLGNSDPFGQGQGNYMTFSAVGVLAGMFSDRVAAWLSQRANAFFSDQSHRDATDEAQQDTAAVAGTRTTGAGDPAAATAPPQAANAGA